MKFTDALAKGVVAGVLLTSDSERCSELLCRSMEELPDNMENREDTMSDDKSIVAALDTEYQEAVKNNDVATMDRILADDFALVTGNGRVYTKADLLKALRDSDVRHLLPRVSVPTLVLHRRNDQAVRIAAGRDMASQIPGAHFVELDGDDHWFFAGDQQPALDAIKRFVGALPRDKQSTRQGQVSS